MKMGRVVSRIRQYGLREQLHRLVVLLGLERLQTLALVVRRGREQKKRTHGHCPHISILTAQPWRGSGLTLSPGRELKG